jgi:hypothetical protein
MKLPEDSPKSLLSRRRAIRLAVVGAGSLLTVAAMLLGAAALAERFSRVEESEPYPDLLRPPGPERYLPLATTDFFSSYHVGYLGRPSPAGQEFRRLLDSPDPVATFSQLAEEGRAGGKLYGLCGLLFASRPEFDRLSAKLANSPERVFVQAGCLGSSSRVGAVLHRPSGHGKSSEFFAVCQELAGLRLISR